MATISTLAVNLIARTSVFEKRIKASRKTIKSLRTDLNNTTRGMAKFARSVKRAGNVLRRGLAAGLRPITSILRTITRLAKVTAVAILAIGTASVKIAADTEETANLFNISMGSMAESANNWVREYSRSLGLFEGNTKKAVSTFQLMLTSMGFAEDAAFDMAKGLTELTNDIASLRNLRLDEAFTKVSAGLTGESEPLKRIGILLNETTIKQLAMNDATRDSTKELTELEKVQFRYKALLNATKRDQGDFKRTIDSTTNVFKIIKEQLLATGNTIGKVFIPQVTKAGIVVRDWLKNNQEQIAKWAIIARNAIGAVVGRLKAYLELAKQGNFKAIFENIGKIFGQLAKGIEEALIRIKPLAVDLGRAIGEGFWASIKDTRLGKFINDAGEIAGNIAAPDRALSALELGRFRGQAGSRLQKRIGSITERASGQRSFDDRSGIDALGELKRIRKAIELSTGTELEF